MSYMTYTYDLINVLPFFFILVVIHINALTSKAEEAEVEQFYEDLRRRQWHPTPVLLPGKPHGWRGLVGCSPWSR